MLGEAQPGPAPVGGEGEGEGRGKRRCSARMRARVGTAEFEGVRGGLEGLCVRGTAEPGAFLLLSLLLEPRAD